MEETTVKSAFGFVKDARGNARYVREMLSQVEDVFSKSDCVEDSELCQSIMALAGLQNAIESMDQGVLDFLDKAVKNLEAAA